MPALVRVWYVAAFFCGPVVVGGCGRVARGCGRVVGGHGRVVGGFGRLAGAETGVEGFGVGVGFVGEGAAHGWVLVGGWDEMGRGGDGMGNE